MPVPTAARVLPPDSREPSLDELVEFEVFDMVARGLPEGFGSGFVPLAVSAVLLQLLASPPHLVQWVMAVATVLGLGLLFGFLYRRHPPALDGVAGWRHCLYVLVGASGLSWGAPVGYSYRRPGQPRWSFWRCC
ncbi:MAG: hypothetical protein NFW16_14800 [Candidatus Accumulibacter sp.]|uniref:hypothetical protein n=1 Tax=Accumulibacter sp. TaxID=2053492 RepID=UPI0025912390|nr:hypothetical protein [Accumulibacter sp.]MCM8622961.1 hypothetical protein [Accumulibacter sp.]